MKTLLTLLILTSFAQLGALAQQKPNVVIFFVDDLGWTDVGCFGSDFYETPNIDRLAAEGVKFTQAYAVCTVCSPTRAALLTGKYPARLHVTNFIPGHPIINTPLTIPDWTQRLKLEEVTIAEVLKNAGYRTAHIGKWHLTPRTRTDDPNSDGDFPEFYPDKHGFDYNIGGCERGAPASYFWPYGRGKSLEVRKANNTFKTLPPSNHGEGTYLTDHLAGEAVRLIEDFGQDPFFLYFPFYNVHTPLQGRPDLVEKAEAKLKNYSAVNQRNTEYAAMVESVDQAIGRVMAQLRRQGVFDRTLVIFSSDNGGLYPQATTNTPLRQGKGSIYEGGVRVPTIFRWPGQAAAGKSSEEPITTVDFFPTIMEATGIDYDNANFTLDGLSLLPLLRSPGQSSLHRDAIYWHYPHYHMGGAVPHSAIRMGDWKLIEHHDGPSVELYNLAGDIHEDKNLASVEPGRASAMLAQLKSWRTSVGAQMPVKNPYYNPNRPTGWDYGDRFRKMAEVRE